MAREDGPAGGDLVVDEQAVACRDVADDVRRPRLLVVAGAPLVDEGDRQIEPLGEAARVLGLADVGGDDHRVRQILAHEALAQAPAPP